MVRWLKKQGSQSSLCFNVLLSVFTATGVVFYLYDNFLRKGPGTLVLLRFLYSLAGFGPLDVNRSTSKRPEIMLHDCANIL